MDAGGRILVLHGVQGQRQPPGKRFREHPQMSKGRFITAHILAVYIKVSYANRSRVSIPLGQKILAYAVELQKFWPHKALPIRSGLCNKLSITFGHLVNLFHMDICWNHGRSQNENLGWPKMDE